MKTASPALIALLDSGTFLFAELFTLTLTDGTVLRYTDADMALVYGGNTYAPFPLQRGNTRTMCGFQVDTMDLTLFGGVDTLVAYQPLPALARTGGFDAARVLVERVFMATWGDTSAGTVHVFQGRVSEVKPTRTAVVLTVSSDLELLNIKLPRNSYGADCRHTLYDAGCGLTKSGWGIAQTAGGGATTLSIPASPSSIDTYFSLGTITFTSGQNVGVSRVVRDYGSGIFTLIDPLPSAPVAGDTFTAYPGCDKTQAMCAGKFSNKASFGGQPYIPRAEAAT